jgi:hypothetical protein
MHGQGADLEGDGVDLRGKQHGGYCRRISGANRMDGISATAAPEKEAWAGGS